MAKTQVRWILAWSPVSRFSDFRRSLDSIAEVARWVWQDGIWRFRSRMLTILIASGVALVCQFAAFHILFTYARALETDASWQFLSQTLTARGSQEVLFAAAVAAFLLLSTYSLLLYSANTQSVRLRRRYEELCEQRVLVLSSRLPHPQTPNANRMLREHVLKDMARRWPRSCGMLLRVLTNGTLPAARTFVCFLVLGYISPFFSAIVFSMLGVAMVLLYRVNLATAQTVKDSEKHRPHSTRERRRLLERSWRSPAPMDYEDQATSEVFSDGDTSRFFDAFFRRYLLLEETGLVLNLLTAFSLLVIVSVAGTGVISGKWSWSHFLAYLLALRFFMTSLMQIGRMLTDASRFSPHVNQYYGFVTEVESADSHAVSFGKPEAFSFDIPNLSESSQSLTLKPGEGVFLMHKGRLESHLTAMLLERSRRGDPQPTTSPYWFIGEHDCVGSTVREYYGFGPNLHEGELRAELAELFEIQVGKAEIELDSVLSEERLASTPAELQRGLAVLAALHSGRPKILIRERDHIALDLVHRPKLAQLLDGRLVIRVVRGMAGLAAAAKSSTPVLLSNGTEVSAWLASDVLLGHPELLKETHPDLLPSSRPGDDIDPDDAEDADDF